jgi:heme oxygenase
VPCSLSLSLDGTLKQGHDMRVFGMGTAATMGTRARYERFTRSMHAVRPARRAGLHARPGTPYPGVLRLACLRVWGVGGGTQVYSAMENELDRTTPAAAPHVHRLWERHSTVLRRAEALAADLADVSSVDAGGNTMALPLSPATQLYVEGINKAGRDDRERGGARLLGHLYCRYFADLFGGQMLALPTRAALCLPAATPRHYDFALPDGCDRRAFIEDVYADLNVAGDALAPDAFDAVVREALRAFEHNVALYSEEPMLLDAARGVLNVALGVPQELLLRR